MRNRWRHVLVWGRVLGLAMSGPLPVWAEPQAVEPSAAASAGESGAEPTAPVNVHAKRSEVTQQLRVAQRTLEAARQASETAGAKAPERLQREVELLKYLDVIIAQQESAAAREQDQQNRLDDLRGKLESIRDVGPTEPKPYSFLLLDHLRDERTLLQARTETVKAAVQNAEDAISRAKEELEAKRQNQRRAKEAAQANNDDQKKNELATAVKLGEWEVRGAAEKLELTTQELRNQVLAQKIHLVEVELLDEKVKWIAQAVVFSPQDLQGQLVEIEMQEADLRNDQCSAEFQLGYAEREWTRLRQQLDASSEQNPTLVEQVEAKQLARQMYQVQISLLNARLQRVGTERDIWNRRFKVITHAAEAEELITWSEEARALRDQLEREKRLQQMRIDELRQDVAGRERKLSSASNDEALTRRWIDDQRKSLRHLVQLHDSNIVSIERTKRLAEKLVGEIEGDVRRWTLTDWADGCKHYAGQLWNMELLTVDEHPLTVGKVLVGLCLVYAGFVIARMLSRSMGRRLQRGRIRMNESGAAALESLSFYALLICFTLTALRFVNVPLTMFTFLGGAIAIGVGFGSQNILNNFISGLILLAERPIKVGDLIQLDDLYGNVEHIGARSTRVRTGGNLEIIVPNSKFLENNVVNLTLGDDRLRTQVSVGIAYGSATRDATRMLKRAAEEHGRVLNNPEPFVWFSDFGDSALVFELHFWVRVRSITDRRRIESDVRYRIDQLFRDAGITIAFPQRDINLAASRPMEVQLVSPPADDRRRGRPSRRAA